MLETLYFIQKKKKKFSDKSTQSRHQYFSLQAHSIIKLSRANVSYLIFPPKPSSPCS